MNLPVILTPLNGKKVELRNFTETDITPIYIGWLNDPRVTRFSNQRFLRHNKVSSQANLATFADSDNLFISIRSRADGCAIGTMTAYINRHHKTADIGLLIGETSYWGKGYGQDSWDILGDWLLKEVGIRKLTAGTAAGNTAMVRIMERFGMQHEATRYSQELIDDRAHDVVYYAKF